MSVTAARLALRDARITETKEHNQDLRAKYGECPRAYDHFDIGSFFIGVLVGIMVGGLFMLVLLHETGTLP